MIFHQLRKPMNTPMFEMSGTKFPSKHTINHGDIILLSSIGPGIVISPRHTDRKVFDPVIAIIHPYSVLPCFPWLKSSQIQGTFDSQNPQQGTFGSRPHNCSHNPGNFLLLSDGSGAKFIPHFSLLFSWGQSEELQWKQQGKPI